MRPIAPYRILAAAVLLAMAAPIAGPSAAVAQLDDSKPPAEVSVLNIPPARIDAAIAKVDGIARDMMHKTGIPGMAVEVVHNDRVVFARGYGVRKAGTTQPVDTDTVFQLASVSKPVGATVVAAAVGKGIASWSDPVAKYIPDFTLSDPWVGKHVTIADLYSHRSGLPGQAGDVLEEIGYDRNTIIHRIALLPLDPFRITYHYSNFGLTSAAEAVARAANMSWEALSKRELYDPIGMHSTSSRFVDYQNAANRAVLHVRVNGKWVARFTREPDAQSPAGGVSSTANDMAKWLRLELANGKFNGQQVVDEKALLFTRVPQVVDRLPASVNGRAQFNGLGMVIDYDPAGRVRLGHAGAFSSGASTAIGMLPSEKLGIVILTNAMPIGLSEAFAQSFFDIAEFGAPQRDWLAAMGPAFEKMLASTGKYAGQKPPANAAAARALTAYAGTYGNAFYGDAIVEQQGAGLVLHLGPQHHPYPMRHWSGDTFTYVPPDSDSVSAIDFTITGSSATSMTIEDFDAINKMGTFTRKP